MMTEYIVTGFMGMVKVFVLPAIGPIIAWQIFVRLILSSASAKVEELGEE